MDKRILIISDDMVKTGPGELFQCLAELRKVWHVGIGVAIDMYEETAGEWDVLIIKCDDILVVEELVAGIWSACDGQAILVVNEHFQYPADRWLLACVAPTAEMVERGLQQLMYGGEACVC